VLLVLGHLGSHGVVIVGNSLVIHFRVFLSLIFGIIFNDFSPFNLLFLILGRLGCSWALWFLAGLVTLGRVKPTLSGVDLGECIKQDLFLRKLAAVGLQIVLIQTI
jgi:hypothetical protein